MKVTVYEYSGCSTCRRALKWLDARKVSYGAKPIVDTPPSKKELKTMLGHVGDIRKLFNTSGVLYRELDIKSKLPKLSEAQALDLLSKNGKLVKRPFLLGPGFGFVGFNEADWKKKL